MYKFCNNFNPDFRQNKHTVHDKFTQLSGVITDANQVILCSVTYLPLLDSVHHLMTVAPAMKRIK